MNFFVDNWPLLAVALASGGMLMWPGLSKGGSGGLSPSDAVMLMNREKAVVIDVCEPDEFAAGHIGAAKNIPLSQLDAKLPGAVKNKSLPVILVCASGIRSGKAVATAQKLGYEKAQSLAGGMKAWREASLPVDKG